jgi:hypothetical protein
MNWKGFGRKQSWHNLGYYLIVCLEVVKRIAEHLSQDCQSLDWDLNPGAAKYEA